MSDFQFLHNPISGKWVVSAPRRAKRPDMAEGSEPVCPFCPGKDNGEIETFRIGGKPPGDENWQVRVLPNKFPFAPIHEVVVLSPDHQKSFDQLPLSHIELILCTYRHQFNEYAHKGQVCIFHNNGKLSGESLPHPHSQIAVMPHQVALNTPTRTSIQTDAENDLYNTAIEHFQLITPQMSQLPDEVWIVPKKRGRTFGEITDEEIGEFATTLKTLITLFDLRHGHEFPYNFYIYPGGDWYLRLIPRLKTIGGFELGTGVYVNTQLPQETMAFIKEHLKEPDIEKIKREHQAAYHRAV